jgi:SAM-dependent methyltransferase
MKRSFLRSFAGHFYRSVVSPAPRGTPVRPWRALVGLPVVYDLVSLFMQTADHRRTMRIKSTYAVDDAHHRAVQDYNAEVTIKKNFTSTRRFDVYYKLLALPPRDMSNEKVLIVGPRSRPELLSAWCHGYKWQNIHAIDLFSANPKIRVMNMEAMTWPNESFDAVTMSATLSYADSTQTAINEVGRVLKPGGRFSFSVSYVPGAQRWKESVIGSDKIAEFLHAAQFEIEIHQAVDKTNSDGMRQTTHAFMARKIPAGEARVDPFKL